jgi:hypothetical protein
MSNEIFADGINNLLPQIENQQKIVAPKDINDGELTPGAVAIPTGLESQVSLNEVTTTEEVRRGNFITRRLSQIRNGYEGLTKN